MEISYPQKQSWIRIQTNAKVSESEYDSVTAKLFSQYSPHYFEDEDSLFLFLIFLLAIALIMHIIISRHIEEFQIA